MFPDLLSSQTTFISLQAIVPKACMVHHATIDDGSLIVEFIKAMASYEGMADRITATENL